MKICKNCIQPDTRPGIFFDESGICGACLWHKEKNRINWSEREQELKKIAEWAAILVNKENDENYITEVRQSDLEKPGDDDIIDKLLSDFKKNKVDMNREKIVEKLNEFENSSKNEIIDN